MRLVLSILLLSSFTFFAKCGEVWAVNKAESGISNKAISVHFEEINTVDQSSFSSISASVVDSLEVNILQEDICDANGIMEVITPTNMSPPYNLEVIYPNSSVFTFAYNDGGFTLSNLNGGLYEITVFSGDDTSFASVFLPEIELNTNFFSPSFFTGGYNVSCNGDCDASLFINIINPSDTYTVDWYADSVYGTPFYNSSEISSSQENLCPGEYAILFTSSTGCESAREFTVREPDSLYIEGVSGEEVCESDPNGFIEVDVFGGVGNVINNATGQIINFIDYTYSWTGPNGYTSSQEDISSLEPGNYTLEVEDNNGCTFTNSFNVVDVFQGLELAELNSEGITCNGGSDGSVEVAATGGLAPYDYRIDGGVWQSSGIFTGLSSGTYALEVKDGNNCIVSLAIDVEDAEVLTSETTIESCDTYTWNGTTYSESGTYTYTTTNANGCDSTATLELSIVENSTGTDTQVQCEEYTWIDGITYTESNNTATFTLTNTQGGCDSIVTLDLTIDICGCTDALACNYDPSATSDDGTCEYEDPFDLGSDVFVCEGSYVLDAGSGYDTYLWSTGETTQTITVTQTGEYSVSTPCSNTDAVFVTLNYCDSLVVNVIQDDLCNSNGILEIIPPSSLTAPYAIDIIYPNGSILNDNFSTETFTLNGLGGGFYEITVSSNNDTASSTVELLENTLNTNFFSPASSGYNVSCYGDCDASLSVNIFNSSETYTIDWYVDSVIGTPFFSTTDFNSSQDNLCPGEYTILFTSSTGCESTRNFTVRQPDSLYTEGVVGEEFCGQDPNGFIEIDVFGGVGDVINNSTGQVISFVDYTYSWTGPNGYTSSQEDISSLEPGNYTLEVEDNNGCTFTNSFNVVDVFQGLELAELNSEGITCNGGSDGSVEVAATGGLAPYDYRIDGGVWQSSGIFTGLSSGTYALEVKDGNNCIVSLAIDVEDAEVLTSETTIESCDTYTWNGTTYSESGTYTYTTTNANGCDSTATLELSIVENSTGTDTQVQCEEYTWIDGITYTESNNTATFTLTNTQGGCDSIVTLDLTIDICGCTDALACNYDPSATSDDGTCEYEDPFDLGSDVFVCEGSYVLDAGSGYDTYLWSTGETTQTITVTQTGEYSVSTPCSNTDAVFVTLNYCDSLVVNVIQDDLCNSNGILEIIPPSSLTAPYAIDIIYPNGSILNDNFSTETFTLNGLGGGFYEITVSSNNDTASSTVELLENTLNTNFFSPASSGYNVSCYGDCDASLSVNIFNSSETYTIDWYVDSVIGTPFFSTTDFNSSQDNLCPGEYTILFTSSTGCESTRNFTVRQPDSLYTEGVVGEEFCGQDPNGFIEIDVFGGVGDVINNSTGQVISFVDYTYSWTGPNGFTSTQEDVSSLEAGDYTLEIEDNNGCTHTNTFTVIDVVQGLEIVLVNSDGIICNGGSDGSVEVAATGGQAPYDYRIEGGAWQSSGEFTGLSTGTYTLEVRDDNNCIVSLDVDVEDAEALSSETTIESCDTYTWNGTTYTESGSYTYLTQNANGCDSTVTLNLSINETTFGTDTQVQCEEYTWIDGITYTASNTTATFTLTSSTGCDSIVTLDLTILEATESTTSEVSCDTYTWNSTTYTESGTYTYTTTNANGCDSTATLNLTINETTFSTDIQSNCEEYTWIDGITYTASNAAATFTLTSSTGCDSIVTLDLTILEATESTTSEVSCDTYTWNGTTYTEGGTYSYTTTNANGCDSTATLNLTLNETTFSTDIQSNCEEYTWIDGITYTESNNTATFTLTNTQGGCDSIVTLDLTIDICGCTDALACNYDPSATSDDGTCEYEDPFDLGSDVFVCEGSYVLDAGSGYDTYLWSTGETTQTITVTQTGEYSVSTPCSNTDAVFVTLNYCDSLVVNVIQDDLCNSNGILEIIPPSSLTAPYAIDIIYPNGSILNDNFSTETFTLNGLGGGFYEITVSSNNDTASSTVELLENTLNTNFFSPASSGYNVSCYGDCDASLSVNIFNSSETYTIDWYVDSVIGTPFFSTTDFNSSQDNLCPGEYTILFTSSTGCESTRNFTVRQPDSLYTEGVVGEEFCGQDPNGFIEIDVFGGVGDVINNSTGQVISFVDYTYSWTGPNGFTSTQEDVSSLEAGDYTLEIEDNNGCTHTNTFTVIDVVQGLEIVLVNSDGIICNGGSDGSVEVAATGGQAPYDYRIEGGAWQSSGEFTGLSTGTYTLEVRDDNNCIVSLDVDVEDAEALSSETTIESCDTYTWNGTTYTESGSYTYLTQNANGCDSTVTLNLSINETTFGTDTQVQCEEYTWIDGITYTASNTTATFTLTSSTGCDSIVTLDLTILEATESTTSEVSCDTYTWNGTTYTESGTYTYTTTNANNCDSTATLNLTINETTFSTDIQSNCEEYTWIDGVTYTESNNTATYTLTNAVGCDSIVTLDLTILEATESTTTIESCDTYTWNGTTYTESGSYTYLTQNANGCDSTVTLNLSINETTFGTDTQVQCEEYTWIDGITYTASNTTATFTLTSSTGCDSIVTLDLTIDICGCTDALACNYDSLATADDGSCEYEDPIDLGSDVFVCEGNYVLDAGSGYDTYLWSTGDTTQTITVSQTGEYFVSTPCTSADTVFVTLNYCDSLVVSVIQDDLCNSNGIIQLIPPSSLTPPYALDVTYPNGSILNDSFSSETFTLDGLGGGFYEITVSSNSDSASSSIEVLENILITNFFSPASGGYNVSCYGECDGSLSVNIINPNEAYTVDWYVDSVLGDPFYSTSDFNSLQDNLCAGEYAILFTSSTGCESVRNVTLRESDSLYTEGVVGEEFCGQDPNGFIEIDVFGGVGDVINNSTGEVISFVDYTYSWTGPNGYTSSEEDIDSLEAGNYTLTIEDNNGCTHTNSFTVLDTIQGLEIVLVNSDGIICNGDSNGSVEVAAIGGQFPYEYRIEGGVWQSSGEFTGLSTGTYTLEVRDDNNCIVFLNADVEDAEALSSETTIESCDTYTWNGTTYTESGSYTYLTQNANGCDSTVTLNLSINETTFGTDTQVQCEEYTWIDGITYTASNTTATFTLTSSTGCDSIVTLDLTIDICGCTDALACNYDSLATADDGSCEYEDPIDLGSDVFVCEGNYVLDAGSGYDTYLWSTGDTTQTITVSQTGEYFVSTPCTSADTVFVTLNYCDSLVVSVIQDDLCNSNGIIQLIPPSSLTPPYALDVTYPNGSILNDSFSSETFTLDGLSGGFYEITVSSNNDTVSSSIEILQNILVTTFFSSFNENSGYDVSCYGECDASLSANIINPNEAYTVDWYVDSVLGDPFYSTSDFNSSQDNLCAGEYAILFTSSTGCESVRNVTLRESDSLYTEGVVGEEFCGQDPNGFIEIDVFGGVGDVINNSTGEVISFVDYTYSWTGPNGYTSSEEDIDSLEAGNYTLTIEDNNGCTHTNSFTVLDTIQGLEIVLVNSDGIICNGDSNGSVEVAAIGGQFPYEYRIEGGVWQSSGEFTGLSTGTYTLEVRDDNNCIVFLNADVEDAEVLTSEATVESCITYEWNGTVYTSSGTYTYTTQNANGCDSTATLNLTISQSVTGTDTQVHCDEYTWIDGITYTESNDTAMFTLETTFSCDSIITLDLTILPNASSDTVITSCDSYVWNQTTFTQGGNYSFITTGSNGCDSIANLELTINQSNSIVDVQEHCYVYTWIDGVTYTESNDVATYTYTNVSGCDSIITLDLTIHQSTSSTEDVVSCNSYFWNGITYTESGTYSLNTTNVNGCDSTAILNLEIIEALSSSVTSVSACNQYTWNGTTYFESGMHMLVIPGITGCDSISTLLLTINTPTSSEENVVACDSYEWNGQLYTEGGVYEFATVDQNGCDSLAVLNLDICDLDELSINGPDDVQVESITSYSVQSNPSSTYQWSVSSLGTIVSGQGTNTISVEWSNIEGLTSICVTETNSCSNITCIGDTLCLDIEVLKPSGISEYDANYINVYPNPLTNQSILEFYNPNSEEVNVSIIDSRGRVVRTYAKIKSDNLIIKKEELSNGLYYIELKGSSILSRTTILIN